MKNQALDLPTHIESKLLLEAPFGVLVFFPKLNGDNNYVFELASANIIAREQFEIPDEIKTQHFLNSIFSDSTATEIYKICVDTLETGNVASKMCLIKLKNVPVSIKLQFAKHNEYIVIYTDDSGGDQFEKGSKAEEEIKFRELFESSLDPIFLAVDNFNITGVNPKFADIFGYSEIDISSLVLADLFKRKEDYIHFVEQLLDQKYVEEYEVELLTAGGEVRYCLINTVAVLGDKGELLMYQGVIRDMTIRREAEQQLMVAEKLTITGKLARSIAHEVRNPLTNIRLALDQFKEEISEKTDDTDFYLDLISRNTDRISNLVTDLMNASKQKTLELKQYHVNEILNETLDLIQDRIKLKEIDLETDFFDHLPIIYLDKNQSKIAFLNLFLNAIEAMEPGKGTLKVSTCLKGKNIVLEISDNGKGIPENKLENLFEPFYTGRKEGSGLGLTTTRNIIHAHKGHIKVSSIVGTGTTFTIIFSSTVQPEQINTNNKL